MSGAEQGRNGANMVPMNFRNPARRNYYSERPKLPKRCKAKRKALKAASRREDHCRKEPQE